MGYGDVLMAIGDAWSLHRRDVLKRPVAIGDGKRVHLEYAELRWGLDFLATPESVLAGESVSWVISHRGVRPYHDYNAMRAELRSKKRLRSMLGLFKTQDLIGQLGHFVFDLSYRPAPAPIQLTPEETATFEKLRGTPFVVIEPNIKDKAAPSKAWPMQRFAEVSRLLMRDIPVYQIGAPGTPLLDGAQRIETKTFRDVFPILKAASLYIGPEGGLHHATAAMGRPAVVLYGGYTSPLVTGYPFHANLTGGAEYACGTQFSVCPHCQAAMNRITAVDVVAEAHRLLQAEAIVAD
jgi:ADP-heptose:LPS heptosyltransferase